MGKHRETITGWPPSEPTSSSGDNAQSETFSSEEVHKLLHELRVHQFELEAQNEELRQIQASLEASWARYVNLYESAPVGYVTLEDKGSVWQANLRAAQTLGITRDDLIHQSLARFIAPEDQDIYYLAYKKMRASGMSRECELRMVRSDHTRIWVRMDMSRAEGAESIHVTFCDVTNRKQAEQEHRELTAKLQENQRLKTLGVLVGGVAHDFNNLLMGIMGNAQLVANDLPPGSPNRPVIEDVLSATQQAAALTDQMLAYAGKRSVELRPIELETLLQETSGLLESAISKRVRLEFDLRADLPAILGDAAQIRQVVINLVVNSSEACGPTGGVVTLRTRLEDAEGELFPDGRCVVLECSDTGGGMDESTKARLFEPFFTTKATGRGLGLAVMEGIIRVHGGKIEVQSGVGEGTTFTLMFPTLEQRPSSSEASVTESSRWAEPRGGTEHLLIVEDSPEVLSLVARILRRAGYEVSTASGGVEGLDIALRRAKTLDLVILDVVMPDLSGPEVLEILKSEPHDLKFMLTTGFTPPGLTKAVFDTDVEVLKKPYHPNTLLNRIRTVLDEAKPS